MFELQFAVARNNLKRDEGHCNFGHMLGLCLRIRKSLITGILNPARRSTTSMADMKNLDAHNLYVFAAKL